MFSKILKQIFVPTSSILLSATVISNSEPSKTPPDEKKMRRSELPIYIEECHCKKSPTLLSATQESNVVLESISYVRKNIQDVLVESEGFVNQIYHVLNTGIAHSSAQIEFLRDEENLVPRIGAIAGSSLLGLLFAVRKGFFKKLIYSATGGLIMASLVYPKEAEEYSGELLQEGKKYALVSYHFLNGVSKDLLGFELPEVPKPLSDSGKVSTPSTDDKPKILPSSSSSPSLSVPASPLDVPRTK